MFKSTVGIAISNFIMIWIVILNNEGPGWEVPLMTMQNIKRLSTILLLCFIFSIVTFLISLKQFKLSSRLFKIIYFVFVIICISFCVFLLVVDGFNGQFWFSNFPNLLFIIVSISINIIFLIFLFIARFRNNNSHTK